METPCPCQSGLDYSACCALLHEGKRTAESAEQLMRSRYSAFAKRNAEYLLQTLHPDKRGADELSQIKSGFQDIEWVGLDIFDTRNGQAGDADGIVEFTAHYRLLNQPGKLRERSRFRFEQGRWFYVDGIQAPAAVPGRNDPCWCGSGRKFKKCHGA